MTAEAVNPFDASPVPVLPPETTPAVIRDALIDEERTEFKRAYRQALAEAAETLDLTRVLDVLRAYHRIAWLTQRQGPQAHRRMLEGRRDPAHQAQPGCRADRGRPGADQSAAWPVGVPPRYHRQCGGRPACRAAGRGATWYAGVLDVLEVAPWSGRPYNKEQPEVPMRELVFGTQGQGAVTYLVFEREREVHVLVVQWVG